MIIIIAVALGIAVLCLIPHDGKCRKCGRPKDEDVTAGRVHKCGRGDWEDIFE
jgi:hypothetical protein